MSATLFAVLPLLMLFEGSADTVQPATTTGTATPTRHRVVLPVSVQDDVPQLSMGPGLLTTLLFDDSLRLAAVDMEEREHFSQVRVLEDALLLVPSPFLPADKKLRLRVRFVEGTRPGSAEFLLVMDPSRTDSHQVNVELRRPPVEDREHLQCQQELERERQQSQGLTGLLATNLMDDTGVSARRLRRDEDFTQRPEDLLKVRDIATYRSVSSVAVEVKLTNRSARPWTLEGAELVGEGGGRLRVLRTWPSEPLAAGETGRVVVEAEAAEEGAQGRFRLSLGRMGEPPDATADGVTFP